MEITAYNFGSIDVEGNNYTSDVIILPAIVKDGWWRKQGHSLAVEDLKEVIAAKPEILVVGTGYYGRMQIPDDTKSYINAQGIELIEAPTSRAVAEFNKLQKRCANIVAALHLTC
jgi:hypothetical protein